MTKQSMGAKTLTLEVTAEDIEKGVAQSCDCCPDEQTKLAGKVRGTHVPTEAVRS